MYMLDLRLTVFSPKALLDASVSSHSYAKIWFKKQYPGY